MTGQDINALVIRMEQMQDAGSADLDEMRQAYASLIRAMANLQVKMGAMTHADRRELLKAVDKLCPEQGLSEDERSRVERNFKRGDPSSRNKGGRS